MTQAYINKKLVAVHRRRNHYWVEGKKYSPRKFWELMPDFVVRKELQQHHMVHW